MNYKSDSTGACLLKDSSGNVLSPTLPPVAYFNSKDKSISAMRTNYSNSCGNISSSTTCIFKNRPKSNEAGYTAFNDISSNKVPLNKQIYDKYTSNSTNQNCEMANVYTATGKINTALGDIKTVDKTTVDNLKNTVKYLSCQVVKARNKQYDLSSMMTNNVYGLKDSFKNYKNARAILAIALFITLYILVNGSFEMVYYFYAIVNYINSNVLESSTNPVLSLIKIGFIVFIILVILYVSFYFIAYKRFGNNKFYDISNNLYAGKMIKIGRPPDSIYWFVGFITLIVFISLFFIFGKINNSNSIFGYFFSAIVFIVIVILLYLFSLKNLNNENLENKSYVGSDEDSCYVYNTMNFGKRIRTMLFWLTFILTFVTVLFIRSVGDGMGETIKMIGSVIALFTIPFIVLFNWFIGITLFFAYPFIIIMLRFARYFYENLISIKVESISGSTKITAGNKRVLGFENRMSASWSLIFGTLIQSVYNISNIRKEATNMNNKGNFNNTTVSNTLRGKDSKLYDFTSNKQFTSPIMNLMLSFINKNPSPEEQEDNQTNFYKNLITIIITMIIWMICYFGIAHANSK
jgi:hypothetical protein